MEDTEFFDFSSDNHSFLDADASSSTLTPHQSSERKSFEPIVDRGEREVDGMGLSTGQQLPELLETAEPETLRKTGKCNLRKSLAWDSAFFESPGFLDAEELLTIIEGAENGNIHHLPGIDEDIGRSTESISTLISDNLTLDSLEVGLFEDIRASIQKSSKASSMATPSRRAESKEAVKLVNSSIKKVGLSSQNRIATNVASTRQAIGSQGSGRIIKKDSSHSQVKQPGLQNGNSYSSVPRSPKVSKPQTMSTITTKRASLGANRIKIESNNSKVGKGEQVPKAAAGPRRNVPKPAISLKTSSSATSGAIKEPGRSSSSSNGSTITLPEKVQKSSLTSARRKAESKPVVQPSSGNIPKAPSKVPLRKKPSEKSGTSTLLLSSNISSSISPSSSISQWSSASSSTSSVNQRFQSRANIDTNTLCSTVNQRFSSRASIDTNSSCKSLDGDAHSISGSDVQSNDDIPDGILNQVKELSSQDTDKMQSGALPRSALMKPSGLRMPSPKIGFFDVAKSMDRTPNGCRQSQSRLPTGLPKIGAAIHSPVGGIKKTGETKLPPGKKATAGANTVLEASKSASPKPSSGSSRTSTKGLSAPRSVLSPSISSELGSSNNKGTEKMRTSTNTELASKKSDSPKQCHEALSASQGISPEVHNETDGSMCLKTEYVANGAENTLGNAPQAETNENLFQNI